MIEIIFVTKDGCGICHLMQRAWVRLPQNKPWWKYTHRHLTTPDDMKEMLDRGITKTPSWIVMRDGEQIGIVSGGMKFLTLVKKLDAIVG